MGWLMYGNSAEPVKIEDRALAHLKVVVTTKLRRQESFLLSWIHGPDQPVGRSSLWLNPSIPLQFTFESSEPPEMNPRWLVTLSESAAGTGNVQLVPEPETGALKLPDAS